MSEFTPSDEDVFNEYHDGTVASRAEWNRWLDRVKNEARAEGFAQGWFAVAVEHQDGIGDINPINGEPLSASAGSAS